MLVGREDELARAATVLQAGASVVVVGEAGAGKTALLDEALRLTARPVRSGQCFRSLAWTAALPLQQALSRPLPAGDPAWAARWVVRSCGTAALHLDDLHWADPLTLAVIALLPPTSAVAATIRLGDPGTAAALDAVRAIGAEVIELSPLDLDVGADLARRLHPELHPAEARALADRCGGNPLLIRELGVDPEPSRGLRRSVAARLRRLGPGPWRDFAMLALAGEPLPAGWFGHAAELTRGGFVVADDAGSLRPRHSLLAEVTVADVADAPEAQRAELHRGLAELADDGGHLALAARSLAGAGERARAADLARRAAAESTRPGERAELLYLAASCADGAQAAELAAAAIAELVAAGEYDRAAALLDTLPGRGNAEWYGLVGRVRWQRGETVAAVAAYEAGLAVAPPGSRDAVLLTAERARVEVLGHNNTSRGLELARQAHTMAEESGVELARALAVLGTAEHFAGAGGDREHLAQAMAAAAAAGDLLVEFTSANNLVAVLESTGAAGEAIAIALRFAERASDLHMLGWHQQMRAMALNAQMHQGDYAPVLSDAPRLLAGPLDRRTRDQLEVTYGITLIDLGRHEDALARLEPALTTCVDDYIGRGNLTWVLAEAYLWAGDPAAARSTALAALEYAPSDHGQGLFAELTLAHAQAQLGETVAAQQWSEPHVALLTGAPLELAGIVALTAGDHATASIRFHEAAAAWAGHHRRGERRCRWLAHELEPNAEIARTGLLALERELADDDLQPLLGRVRRSLRTRGVRRTAPRGRRGALTAREREVLDLVAAGLSTEAVAARLGLAPSTVAAQIASARARLGASSRWSAASG